MTVQKKKAVVLLSGGMDSSVVLAQAISHGFEVFALTFRYGQRHQVEIDAACKQTAAFPAARHTVFDLNLSQFGGSALTTDMDVPKNVESSDIPVTYVPARNTVFLSVALSYAEAIGARDIFIGVSSVDYSGYPDCRPAFIEAFEQVANLGTKAADGGERFRIHAPLIRLTKEETVQLGNRLNVNFANTHTCYDPAPNGTPCGECDSCRLRIKGFTEAGLIDPAMTSSKE
ncbi:MAG: 7-cyano-7-deazaguanine synthase QueC [Deltaproteobacteria bacterium]|nr:7-cyano-7-deazaguanine synthase QueC [Deltaproteobacteria bacterium]MBN2671720.1 7-cyano-7-deazaguanine synthase QueC [Deltaproteobacteria bacterium]